MRRFGWTSDELEASIAAGFPTPNLHRVNGVGACRWWLNHEVDRWLERQQTRAKIDDAYRRLLPELIAAVEALDAINAQVRAVDAQGDRAYALPLSSPVVAKWISKLKSTGLVPL